MGAYLENISKINTSRHPFFKFYKILKYDLHMQLLSLFFFFENRSFFLGIIFEF